MIILTTRNNLWDIYLSNLLHIFYSIIKAGVVEAYYAKAHNNQKISLSEQELVDCVYPDDRGCKGGEVKNNQLNNLGAIFDKKFVI